MIGKLWATIMWESVIRGYFGTCACFCCAGCCCCVKIRWASCGRAEGQWVVSFKKKKKKKEKKAGKNPGRRLRCRDKAHSTVTWGTAGVLLTVPSCCRPVGSTSSLGGPHFSALFPEGKTEGSSVCHGLLTPHHIGWRTFANLRR